MKKYYPFHDPRHATVLGFLVVAGCATPTNNAAAAQGGSLFGSKGSPWTIQCLEIQGTDRMQRIESVAESLRRTAGIRPKDVFVRDEPDGFARLYYGTYYRRTDKKTGKRSTPPQLQKDMELIKQLGSESGKRYFMQSMIVRMPTPNVGNSEWALSQAKGVYSLQVAVFEPHDDFWEYKQAAAEYCEFLRKKGHEAFYHHASASSMVTVGSFGKEAVVNMPQGLPRYSAEVLALQKNELLKHNLLNGAVYYVRDGKGGRTAVPSRLVEIPRKRAGTAVNPPVKILIATTNRGKLREVQSILSGLPVTFVNLDEFPALPIAVEDADTFEGNAERKALHFARLTRLWTLADDSGLEVDALGGGPGVYSARFAGRQGDDAANNVKLIAQLVGVPIEKRTARFRCAVALAGPEGIVAKACGTFEGRIVDDARGNNGFGYDPHFYVPELGVTAAQLAPQHKNRISHRAQALSAIRPLLERFLQSGTASFPTRPS